MRTRSRMLKLKVSLALVTAMLTLAGAYAAAPFVTAWSIREAIRNNDSTYLEHKIEWEGVRSTLKASLASYTLTPAGNPEERSAHPGLWQRIKAYFGRGALDRFVDATVTPTGLNGLFTVRKAYRSGAETVGITSAGAEPSRFERMRRVWARTIRAEFTSLTRLELDMLDKDDPARTIACVLELRGLEWKVTELRVRAAPQAGKLAATRLLTM